MRVVERVASARSGIASPKGLARASIANSLLLPVAAALHFNVTFWLLVVTNFLLFHAIWITQLPFKKWSRVDWGWHVYWWPLPLVAFAVLGNLSLAFWEAQLLSVFPS